MAASGHELRGAQLFSRLVQRGESVKIEAIAKEVRESKEFGGEHGLAIRESEMVDAIRVQMMDAELWKKHAGMRAQLKRFLLGLDQRSLEGPLLFKMIRRQKGEEIRGGLDGEIKANEGIVSKEIVFVEIEIADEKAEPDEIADTVNLLIMIASK